MSRFDDIVRFLEYDLRGAGNIEAEKRTGDVLSRLSDVVGTYRPGVIVKAGIGRGTLLLEMVRLFTESHIVVVEPSFLLIHDFIKLHGGDEMLSRVKFINGDFKLFPVDYYKADLLVCVDYLDIQEIGPVIDEFRRALQFDGIFFLGQVVLHDGDLDGVYDDFMREIHPLHTDYYLVEDLKTVLDLKEFSFIKGDIVRYDEDLDRKTGHLRGFYPGEGKDHREVIDRYRKELETYYSIKDATVSEPYFLGIFQRRKMK